MIYLEHKYNTLALEYLEKAKETDPNFTRGDFCIKVLKEELIN